MTWLNPWAWLGLLSVAVPVAIHLLTRAQPRPVAFPTLRFLTTATTTAIRRRSIRDRWLLLVRGAILASVVAAVAEPVLRSSGGPGGSSTLRRAVVIDTSASMTRPAGDGQPALTVARDRAAHLEPTAGTTIAIDTPRLADGLGRAVAWLTQGGGRREIVVVSDFQRGALNRTDLDRVPAGVGVRLTKIEVPLATSVDGPGVRLGGQVWTPHLTLDPDRTTVNWKATASGPTGDGSVASGPVDVSAGLEEARMVRAATAAVNLTGVPVSSTTHRLRVVLPLATDRPRLLDQARPVDAPWMFTLMRRLGEDATLEAAAQAATAVPSTLGPAFTVVARDRGGAPLALAASGPGAEFLILAQVGPAGASNDLAMTALLAAVARAQADPAAVTELEPVTVTATELQAWERPTPAVGSPSPAANEDSQGRWFWLLALALLAMEGYLRRPGRAASPAEVTRARVA